MNTRESFTKEKVQITYMLYIASSETFKNDCLAIHCWTGFINKQKTMLTFAATITGPGLARLEIKTKFKRQLSTQKAYKIEIYTCEVVTQCKVHTVQIKAHKSPRRGNKFCK